jgi:copper(I)-binding protein
MLALLPVAAQAAEPITITEAWSPPSLSQTTAVGFFYIASSDDDAVTGAHSDCCTAVEIHEHIMDGDVMRMRRVEKLALPAGKDVALQPGGYHVMLIGLKNPTSEGETIKATLEFEHAPPQLVTFTVRPATSHGHH